MSNQRTILSSKINIWQIVKGHHASLADGDQKCLKSDIFTFYGLPIFASLIMLYFNTGLNGEIASLLVNFSAIFTALLLSVLVLVYDQENKMDGKNDALYDVKKQLLKELYFNISYAIISSLSLIFICITHYLVKDYSVYISTIDFDFIFDNHLIVPLVTFITLNLFLTIVMIVKRMHALLITANN